MPMDWYWAQNPFFILFYMSAHNNSYIYSLGFSIQSNYISLLNMYNCQYSLKKENWYLGSCIIFISVKIDTNICSSLTSQKSSKDKLSNIKEEVRNGRCVSGIHMFNGMMKSLEFSIHLLFPIRRLPVCGSSYPWSNLDIITSKVKIAGGNENFCAPKAQQDKSCPSPIIFYL